MFGLGCWCNRPEKSCIVVIVVYTAKQIAGKLWRTLSTVKTLIDLIMKVHPLILLLRYPKGTPQIEIARRNRKLLPVRFIQV